MKKILFSLIAAMIVIPVVAREISSDEAGRAAAAWVRRDNAPLGMAIRSSDVAEVRTQKDGDTPLFHVVRMTSGGVVVTSAESGVTPVVAFLDGDGIDETDGNPLWKILNTDMSNRLARVRSIKEGSLTGLTRLTGSKDGGVSSSLNLVKPVNPVKNASSPFAAEEAAWAELLDDGAKGGLRLTAAIPDASGISDLRVPAILTSSWNQSGGAANYYTPLGPFGAPTNFPCGCVALVGAQIARHWRFPTESVPQVVRECWVSGVPGDCQSMGGVYDWTNMPDDFSALTLVQQQAVGKLCYDFGVAVQMGWNAVESGTTGLMLSKAFTDVFGYANAKAYFHGGNSVMPDALVERAVLANLDAGCPVALGLYGHEAVADGYGFEAGTLYTHLNLGWGGSENVWYNLPDVDSTDYGHAYTSTVLDEVVYNIFPDATGELLTGRVLDANGDPVSGATVYATSGSATVQGTTNGRGIYALLVSGGRPWTVIATDGDDAGSLTTFVAASVSAEFVRVPVGATVTDCGKVGNSWGNDVTLGVDVPADGIFFVDEATGNDANDGRSWATSKASIQAAVDASSADDIVVVADGRYEPITTANKAITIQSLNGPETTFIDGSLQWARGVTNRCATLGSTSAQTNTVLVGLCLTNGIAIGSGYSDKRGGGSYAGTLRNCLLSGNEASSEGGGAYYGNLSDCTLSGNSAGSYGGGAFSATLSGCTITNNAAQNGGGVEYGTLTDCAITGNRASSSGGGTYSATLTGCTISGNTASSGGGSYSGTLTDCLITDNICTSSGGGSNSGTLSNCTLSGNTARYGGGSYGGDLTDCTITNNTSSSSGGGSSGGTLRRCRIFGNAAPSGGGSNGGTLRVCRISRNTANYGGGANGGTLIDCEISYNFATNSGGGFYHYSSTTCKIGNSSFIGNSAATGGGSCGGALTGCVLTGNHATSNGGGAQAATLDNGTVFGNSATAKGGGTHNSPLNNCIVWGNTAAEFPAHYGAVCRYSCLDGELRTEDNGGGNIYDNPLFVNAVNEDFHLQEGSPCIDAGTNGLATAETDFDGNPRIVGGRVDMGAYEYQPQGGYASWAAQNGLGAADAVTDGQPNLVRYVFDRPTGAFSPFTGISFQSGKPVVTLLPLVNTDGVTMKVLSTTNLTDWTSAEERTLTVDDNGRLTFDHESDPQRFYKLKAE